MILTDEEIFGLLALSVEANPPERDLRFARFVESAVLEKLKREPKAHATEDGERVVTAITYAGAKRDGGATWSSMRPFSVPLYADPVPAAAAPAMQKGIK